MCEITPNAGRIMIYTSGCPKNQKICWNITGSPPPAASKNDVPKLRSVNIMVTAPANTGIAPIRRNDVINHVHTKRGMSINFISGALILRTVAIILIAPIIDEKPKRCMAKMKKSVLSGANVVDSGA